MKLTEDLAPAFQPWGSERPRESDRRGNMMVKTSTYVAMVCLLALSICSQASAVRYQIADLGMLPDGISVDGMNSTGQIVGSGGDANAIVYTPGSDPIHLGVLGGGLGSHAYAANGNGQVVGQSRTDSAEYHAFLYAPGSGMVDLGTLGGTTSSAKAISSAGQVTGYAYTNDANHAFVWTPGAGMTDLGTLGGWRSAGCGINDQGQITGDSSTDKGSTHAFLYTPGPGMTDIGTLGGATSYGIAINNQGQVAGNSRLSYGIWMNAFLYKPGIGMVDLGALGERGSSARSMNNHGQVVGSSDVQGSGHAFVYTPGYGMTDLGTLGGAVSSSAAYAIDDAGRVFGLAYTASDHGDPPASSSLHIVVWTPVPEPSSLLALLAGLGGVGGMVWRRRR